MITLGEVRLHVINDCMTQVDAGGAFGLVPRVLFRDFMTPDAANLIPSNHHNLVVQTPTQNWLIDTSYGDKLSERQRAFLRYEQADGGTIGGLERLGLTPDDIHGVILTHLHGDHAGGATRLDESGAVVPTFPNAEYFVQRREYDDAMQPNERTRATYLPINYQPLLEGGRLTLLDGDHEFIPGVRGVVTPGHTPGHMSVILEGDDRVVMFTCDLATYSIHFERLGWMTAYDVEPLMTLETKRRWQTWALETDALLIFPHDPIRPAAHLVEDETGRRLLRAAPLDFT